MKPLFRNYNFEFSTNEKRLLNQMVKQIFNQIIGDSKYASMVKIYESILNKLSEKTDIIKFTKEEVRAIETQLIENIKHLQDKVKKSWFIKRWFLKSVLVQYESLYNNYFKDQRK